jgi:membrane associated rhomboid family serine protease
MIQAPVGFQCPECVKGAPPVRRYADVRRAATNEIYVTFAIIGINVAVFLLGGASVGGNGGSAMNADYGLFGPLVATGEWYRLITSGFLHQGLFHIGFNMWILYQLGQMLEPHLGRVRFGALYLASLLGGSVGALVVSPDALTVGASGAVFGCMAAVAVALRSRGVNPFQTSIGSLLVINLVITFAVPGISIGGHVGGLATGALAGFVFHQTEGKPLVGAAVVSALALVLLGVGVSIA